MRPSSIALLSYGFRPFFLGAALWACAAMILWIGLLAGTVSFAQRYGAVAWHAHEFLFGYIAAVLSGFLLTAIPNWTGRMPLQGSPLLGLVSLWLAGRIAMLMTDTMGNVPGAIVDSSYLVVFSLAMVREIVTGKNWRNLKVVLLVAALALANILYHAEVIYAGAPEYGLRIAIAVIIAMIMLVGGRIIPSFTHNWLARQGVPQRPAPIGRFDFVTIAFAAAALICWVPAPGWYGTGILLLVGGIAQAARLSRWAGERTWREPIVLILHIGYALVPLGALTLAASILWPQLPQTGALHAWTTGAMGIMTLAVMTRATRGHTGRTIESTPTTILIYAAVLIAAFSRVAAPLAPAIYMELLYVSAAAWLIGFGAFVASYGPMLVTARRAG